MAEPQLSVRSAKAIELAHRLSRQTGRTIGELVEEALADMEKKIVRQADDRVEAFWAPIRQSMEEGRAIAKAKGVASDTDELYDEAGLPKL